MIIYVIGRAFPDTETGMIGTFELHQAKALNDENNDVHYIYFDNRYIDGKKYIKNVEKTVDGVPVHGFEMHIGDLRLPKPVFYLIKNGLFNRKIKRVINEFGKPDIVHIHFPLISITEETWEYLKQYRISCTGSSKCRLFVTEHWSAVQKKELNSERRSLLNKIYEEADGFICVGEDLRKSVIAMCGDNKDVRVIPNMVSNTFKEAVPVFHQGFRFVSVGRFVPSKRFDLLVEAFTKAFKGNMQVKLAIVGGGDLYETIKQQVHKLDMDSQITLMGYKTPKEVSEIFSESDCYVSSSELETFCVPVAEAWMVGLPCIVTDHSSIRYYVKKENGCIFRANKVDSLADSMKNVQKNCEDYCHEKIKEEAINLFSEQIVKNQILDYYNEPRQI